MLAERAGCIELIATGIRTQQNPKWIARQIRMLAGICQIGMCRPPNSSSVLSGGNDLWRAESNREAAGRVGCVDLIATVTRTHLQDDEVIAAAFYTLFDLCFNEGK